MINVGQQVILRAVKPQPQFIPSRHYYKETNKIEIFFCYLLLVCEHRDRPFQASYAINKYKRGQCERPLRYKIRAQEA